jgi:trk system potassium uptake protein TrkA
MRIVFVGTGTVTLMTARRLIEHGHEVIIIESNRDALDQWSESMDCSFLYGDGSSPEVLRETDPKSCDILFCLTGHDQINIIANLVGRSLGFKRVVASISDAEYEPVCQELGLDDTIFPTRTISRYLADMVAGIDILELRTAIKDEARLFSFTATDDDAGPLTDLQLPSTARVVWYYRKGNFVLADEKTQLLTDDEVVIATHSENLELLQQRWQPKNSTSS